MIKYNDKLQQSYKVQCQSLDQVKEFLATVTQNGQPLQNLSLIGKHAVESLCLFLTWFFIPLPSNSFARRNPLVSPPRLPKIPCAWEVYIISSHREIM